MDSEYGSTGSVSLRGITPAYGDEDILIDGKRPDRWTDLHAVAAVAYQVLTGNVADATKTSPTATGKTAHPTPAFKRGLRAAGVPAAIVEVILKARTKRDDRLAPDKLDTRVFPSALAAADAIQNWRDRCVRRRHGWLVAALLLLVALPGALGWFKWDEARQGSEIVASRRMIADLQQQVGQLVTREHAAVKTLLDEAGKAARQLDEAPSRGQPLSDSLQLANDVRFKLRQALELGQGIERGSQQRAALGSVLLEQDRVSQSGFWVTDAPTIRQRLTDLQTRYVSLGQRLDTGEIGLPASSFHRDPLGSAFETSPSPDLRTDSDQRSQSAPQRVAVKRVEAGSQFYGEDIS